MLIFFVKQLILFYVNFIKVNTFTTFVKYQHMNTTVLKDIGLAVLRIGASALMLVHGYGKLLKLVNGEEFGNPIGIGATPSLFLTVIGEFVCPLLIIIGLKTRLSAIPVAITMAVAAFVVHSEAPIQKKELALIYFIIFTAIAFLGPGRLSIDRK